jgi:TonB family protein
MASIKPVNDREDQHPLFAAYEVKPQQGKDRFVLSTVLHAAVLAIVVQLPGWFASPRVEPVVVARVTPLIEPALVKKVVLPPPKIVAKVETPKVIVAPPTPKRVEVVEVIPPKIKPKEKEVAVTADVTKVVPAKKEILTTTYASGSSAPPTLQKPPREVQTGGFGDPMGVRGTSDKGALRVAALGSFDLPSGPGTGNGTGGARGAKGTVASSGFGNGVAGPGSGDRGRRGQTAQAGQSGFDQVAAPTVQKNRPPVTAALTPVEILYKPKPVYTDEARRLHVEGEVLMEVTFSANGRLQDMRVVRGLGHGLDEAAQRAAAQIKFRPAKRDGQPLDSTAFVHIVFELAE